MRDRKLNRLGGWNYSSDGWYFVTICIDNKENLLGEIENKKMILNDLGGIVNLCWLDLPNHYKNCVLDEFVIMPDHVHGIIGIANVGNGLKPFRTEKRKNGLSEIVRGFKTFSSRKINLKCNFKWHKSFHDRIIRNEIELNKIRNYIKNNPKNLGKNKNK